MGRDLISGARAGGLGAVARPWGRASAAATC